MRHGTAFVKWLATIATYRFKETDPMNTIRRIWLFARIVYRISDTHPDGSIVRMAPRLAWKVAGIVWPDSEPEQPSPQASRETAARLIAEGRVHFWIVKEGDQ